MKSTFHRQNFFGPRFAHSPSAAGTPPSYLARVTAGIALPVLTLISAVWFAAMAIAAVVLYSAYDLPGWNNTLSELPRWVAMLALLLVFAMLALPLGAARRATTFYANGGRLHGWADVWSKLLWLAVVALIFWAGWQFSPELRQSLETLFGPTRNIAFPI